MRITLKYRIIIFILLFSLTGYFLSIRTAFFMTVFPALFGISVPLALYRKLGKYAIIKVVLSALVPVGVFYLAFLSVLYVGDPDSDLLTILLLSLLSGIAGVLSLLFFKILLDPIDPSPIQYLIAFVLCAVPVPIGIFFQEAFIVFIGWSLLLAVGLSFSLKDAAKAY